MERCLQCGKTCKLWENSVKWDEKIVEDVKKEADPDIVAHMEKLEKDKKGGHDKGLSPKDANQLIEQMGTKLPTPANQPEEEDTPAHWEVYHRLQQDLRNHM
jgi:hypothetical protein